jgi:hypothetical protein
MYADVCWRMLTYADVYWHEDVCWRMLTYADVCWRMLTYARYSSSELSFLPTVSANHITTAMPPARREGRHPTHSRYMLRMCPHTYHICVLIHTTYVSSYILHMCPHTYYICVLILRSVSTTTEEKVGTPKAHPILENVSSLQFLFRILLGFLFRNYFFHHVPRTIYSSKMGRGT